MAKKDIRVLALDLDGTLTNDQKVVTPATRAALDAAAAKGVTIVLASGRPTAGVMPVSYTHLRLERENLRAQREQREKEKSDNTIRLDPNMGY